MMSRTNHYISKRNKKCTEIVSIKWILKNLSPVIFLMNAVQCHKCPYILVTQCELQIERPKKCSIDFP